MREKIQETGLTRRIALSSVLPAEPAGTRPLLRPRRTDLCHPHHPTDRLSPSRPRSRSLFPSTHRSGNFPEQTSPSLPVATSRLGYHSPQSTFPYKYYIDYGAEREDPESEHYLAPWDENSDFGYEEPVTTGGADRIFQFGDSETQSTGTEYFNGLNAAAVILANDTPNGSLQVHFHIDMEPATNNDEQPFEPETHNVYLQMESKITALTQGFPSGANYLDETPTDSLEFLRFTDDNDDMIYDLTLDLRFPTLNDFGFVIRYEDPDDPSTSPITNGGGFDPGRRYYKFIQPNSAFKNFMSNAAL